MINEVNIGKGYNKKLGDLEAYFGKSDFSSDDSIDILILAHRENIRVSKSLDDDTVDLDSSNTVNKELSSFPDSLLLDPAVM